MRGSRNTVATQILSVERRAVYLHCFGHALNLAVGDTIKQSKGCREALETAFEICKLIKYSSERNAALNRIKAEMADEDTGSSVGIRSFCAPVEMLSAASLITTVSLINFGKRA